MQALDADASEAVLRVAREQQAELDAEGRAGHADGGLLRGQVCNTGKALPPLHVPLTCIVL